MTTATVKTTVIGRVDDPYNGWDAYVVIEVDSDSDLKPGEAKELAHDAMVRDFWRECRGPGTQFCKWVEVLPLTYSDTQFVGRACIRFDI